jgi:hypothetical protein
MKAEEKKAANQWDDYRKNLKASTTVDKTLSFAERERKRQELEANPAEWMREMFPNYCTAPFARFHIKAINRIINNPENYEVLSWSRELAKSTVVMMAMMYLALTGKKKNVILVSNSYDNANRLLEPYRINFEDNQRIEYYYGQQKNPGSWNEGDFTTKKSVSFRALGAGQSPRGSRNEAARPDSILIDDIDTDQDCLNPDIIQKRWEWIEQALIPTRSISNPLLLVFCGNIIARDCCITRAGAKADNWDVVNIRDKNGVSSWPEKNSEEQIDRVLSTVSTKSSQQEYYNNPISEGTTFKELRWGPVPTLSKFSILVAYGDPAPSNKTSKKGLKPNKTITLLGMLDGNLYVITCFLESVTNSQYVDWYYMIHDYAGKGRAQVYYYIENNSLQDPFYEQVFIPLFVDAAKQKGVVIPISPDDRKKPDKFSRIEGNLEPLNRAGRLIMNERERDNPHMQRLEEQFKLVQPGLPAPADGPDSVEGGYWILQAKISSLIAGAIEVGKRHKNEKRV